MPPSPCISTKRGTSKKNQSPSTSCLPIHHCRPSPSFPPSLPATSSQVITATMIRRCHFRRAQPQGRIQASGLLQYRLWRWWRHMRGAPTRLWVEAMVLRASFDDPNITACKVQGLSFNFPRRTLQREYGHDMRPSNEMKTTLKKDPWPAFSLTRIGTMWA